MQKLIKDHTVVDDDWRYLRDTDGLSADTATIIPLDYWLEHATTLADHSGPLGLEIPGDSELDSFIDALDRFAVIAIHFPKFADGRGYSSARLLRERHHYDGELRATGDVLHDQLFYMSRCGFNAFELRAEQNMEYALKALQDFSVVYQASSDINTPIYRRRSG